MKTLLPELQKEYKEYKSLFTEYAKISYQKKVKDKKWIKYFINCDVYDWLNHWTSYTSKQYDSFEFSAQFCNNNRSINISTVARTNDPLEKRRPYPTLQEIEAMFEKMWIAYGSEYYETFLKIYTHEQNHT